MDGRIAAKGGWLGSTDVVVLEITLQVVVRRSIFWERNGIWLKGMFVLSMQFWIRQLFLGFPVNLPKFSRFEVVAGNCRSGVLQSHLKG